MYALDRSLAALPPRRRLRGGKASGLQNPGISARADGAIRVPAGVLLSFPLAGIPENKFLTIAQ